MNDVIRYVLLYCLSLQTLQDVFPFNLYSKDAETRQLLTSAAQGFVDRFVGLDCYAQWNQISLCMFVVHVFVDIGFLVLWAHLEL